MHKTFRPTYALPKWHGLVSKGASVQSRTMQIGVTLTVASIVQLAANGSSGVSEIGGYHVYVIDFAVASVLLAMLSGSYKVEAHKVVSVSALAFACLYLVWVLRGLEYDVWKALANSRVQAIFPIFCVSIVAAQSPLLKLDRYLPPLILGTLVILCLFAARLLAGNDFLIVNVRAERMIELQPRPLDAYSALFLGLCSMLFTYMALTSRDRQGFVGFGLLGALALGAEIWTRQRSASLATLSGFLVLVVFSTDLRKRIPAWLKGSVLLMSPVMLLLVVFLIADPDSLSSLVPEEYLQFIAKADTLDFRQRLWSAALADFSSQDWVGMLFGTYSGYQPNIVIDETLWVTTLHSMYVQTLVNLGILGCAVLFVMVFIGLVSAVNAARRSGWTNSVGLPPEIALAWLVGMCVFGYAYEWIFGVSIFVALACAPGWSRRESASPASIVER